MNYEAWKNLESRALWHLEHADQLSPREPTSGMAMQLRLWEYPPLGVHVSWSVIVPVRDYRSQGAIVREVTWDRPCDWKLGTSPLEAGKRRQDREPSVRIRDAEVAWADLAPSLDVLGGMSRPMPADLPAGNSGEDAFGLEGYRTLAHVGAHWTGKGPWSCRETIARVTVFRKLLIRFMRERETD